MFVMSSFKKSLIVEQFQGNYLKSSARNKKEVNWKENRMEVTLWTASSLFLLYEWNENFGNKYSIYLSWKIQW